MNISALDPIANFCMLSNHVSIIRADKLYIVQGNGAYRIGEAASAPLTTVEYGNDPWIRSLSLNDSFPISDIGSYISIVAPTQFSNPLAQRANPILWSVTSVYQEPGDTGIAIYTMGLPVGNISSSDRGNSVLWTDDLTTFHSPSGAFQVDRPWSDPERYFASRNQYFDSEEHIGYIVGGLVGDTPTGTFLTYITSTGSWRNASLPWGVTSGDGAMGSFRINNRTVHVYVGGTVNGEISRFDIARVFDSRSNIWYDQPLTGYQNRIPSPRRGSCSAVVAAPDGSSYQMLMFGGASGDDNELPFGELWALNIPAFNWVLLDNSPEGTAQHIPGGRTGSSCHLIRGNKLLVFGGSKIVRLESSITSTNCDSRQNAGFIMNLNNITWLESYDGQQSDYQVPERIRLAIGGEPTGGATMVQPVSGFADPTLSEILRVPVSTSTTSVEPDPTAGPAGGGLPTGGIVGIAIGAVLLAIGGLFFLYRWRRNRKRQKLGGGYHDPNNINGKSELPGLSNSLGYDEQRGIYKDNAGNVIAKPELGGDTVSPTELAGGDTVAQQVMELPVNNEVAPVELPADTYAELPDRNSTLGSGLQDSQLPVPPTLPKAPES